MQKGYTILSGKNTMSESGILRVYFDTFSSKNEYGVTFINNYSQSCSVDFRGCSSNGKEKDYESGFHYYGARYYWSEVLTGWLSVDPMMNKYPSISPYAYCTWNPVKLVDPDGRAVIPTNALKENSSVLMFFRSAEQNSVFRYILRRYYSNQSNVYFHLAQAKNDNGSPTGISVLAQTQPASVKDNPVGKYGIERIIINSDILSNSGYLIGDPTFLFYALMHEGIHARLFDVRQSDHNYSNYPGYRDYLIDRDKEGNHHNYMGAVCRAMLIKGMKEFDTQYGISHTEDWYEAISWTGLQDSRAWEDFRAANPELAVRYLRIQNEELNLIKTNKAIE